MTSISSKHTRIVLMPGLGGRIVLWQVDGGANLLDADPADWNPYPEKWPVPTPVVDWDPGRGHIVWAGPQATWWTDQDRMPGLKAKASDWPPDPILTAAPYTVLEQTTSAIELESSVSPYTGLKFLKKIELLPDDRVRVHVIATNMRDRPIRRNLWFNFRAPGGGRAYVPLADRGGVRLEGEGRSAWDGPFHSLELLGTRAKAFLPAAAGFIASEVPGGFVILRFAVEHPDQVPPDHAPVEIFRGRSPNLPDLLELEHHGPLVTLAPGESIEREETWEFAPFAGPPSERIGLLEALLSLSDKTYAR